MPALVQQVAGSAVSNYGIGTTAISTSPGNALVLFAGYNYGVPGTFVTTPAVSVSDSAGNLWRQIAITPGGTTVAATTRCAVWMTVNALPVTWVSVGLTGYATAAAWNVAEFSGLAQAISVDFGLGVNSYGTIPSLTGIASQSDIGFAVVASGLSNTTITGPISGFSLIGAATAGNSGDRASMSMASYWTQGITAGTVAYSTGINGAGTIVPSYSYALCAINKSASPPPQFDIRHPLNTVEVTFGATPGNPSSSVDYTFSSEYVNWQDISTRVIGNAVESRLTASRGRQYELQTEEAGEFTAMLNNVDGAFTPTNPGSPYYSSAVNVNMSFQSGLNGWALQNVSTIAQSSAFAFASGINATAVFSMQVTPSGANAQPGARCEYENINPNYHYSASAWFYVPAGWASGAQVNIDWATPAGSFISTTTGVVSAAIPAGTWIQAFCLNATPAAFAGQARITVQLVGTPSAGTLFYVAEAALVTGSQAVQTGLISLKTPVRITTWWQGRQYPVWMGYAERWPQSWPEFPQWGFSKLQATDAIAIGAANSMFSALIGEVLIDNPYAYLPCNEQYTNAQVGSSTANTFFFSSPALQPADANGLTAVNKATNNQITGIYADGQTQQVSTGITMNFFGDNSTGLGATGYAGQDNNHRGPSMLYTDPNLSAVCGTAAGFTIEFWFTWNGTSSQAVSLLTGYGIPSAFWTSAVNLSNGAVLGVYIQNGTLFASTGIITTVTPSQSPQHCVLVISGTGLSLMMTVFLNGINMGIGPLGNTATPGSVLTAIVLGPGRYSCDANGGNANYIAFNFSVGHLAVYGYQLSASRILAHFKTGATGQAGVSASTRFSQILTWGQLGLKRGGYSTGSATGTPEITQMGPAYQLSGSPASSAINSVAQSEGGQYFVKADGTITYLERVSGYNLPVSVAFGDNASAAPDVLNPNPDFSSLRSPFPWTAGNATLAMSSAQTYITSQSAFLTPTSAAGTAGFMSLYSPPTGVLGGSVYTAFAWVFTPAGYNNVYVGFDWFSPSTLIVSNLQNYSVAPGSWTCITTTQTAPISATTVKLRVGESSSPGTGATLYVAYGATLAVSPEIPFQQATEFDYDDNYLYNEVTATQVDGPNNLIIADDRNPPSQQQYFRRSALAFQSDVVSPYDVSDVTSWSIAQFAQPFVRASEVNVHPSADPLVIFPAVLGLDIGDIVQVTRRPVGGAAISETGIIERVKYDIGARYFYIAYQIAAYQPANDVLCADTPGFDTPGTTTLGW